MGIRCLIIRVLEGSVRMYDELGFGFMLLKFVANVRDFAIHFPNMMQFFETFEFVAYFLDIERIFRSRV
jgi:hypothetical protein